MTNIDQLPLTTLPIASAEFGRDPMPYLTEARLAHEWLARSEIGFVGTGYRAIDHILRLDQSLKIPGDEIVGIMGAEGTGLGQFAIEQMLVSDGVRHDRLRGSVSAAFGPGSVKRLSQSCAKRSQKSWTVDLH